MMKTVTEEIEALREAIRSHHPYSPLNDPVISDADYDQLVSRLMYLERAFPGVKAGDSSIRPMERGAEKTFTEVTHRFPIIPPKRGFSSQDIREFDESIRKALKHQGVVIYTVEPKIVGLCIQIVYENGTLKGAFTKGDGYQGEDVTANIKTLLSVPLQLTPLKEGRPPPDLLEVRGIVYMETKDFETLNERIAAKGLPPFSTLRTAVSGSLVQLDPRATAKRPLNMFCCGIGEISRADMESYHELLTQLQDWGLRVNRPYMKVCTSIDDILNYCLHLEEVRERLPYRIDGAAIQVDSLSLQAKLGQDCGHAKWALSYLFAEGRQDG